jgi:hypothetical protein
MPASVPRNQFLICRAAGEVSYRATDILSGTVHRNMELQVRGSGGAYLFEAA